MSETKRGWGAPTGSRKWHYFNDSHMSLCGKWGFYQGFLQEGNDDHPDNCATCKRKLRALAKARGEDDNAV